MDYNIYISLLKKLIAIPSISRKEQVCANYLEKYIKIRCNNVHRKGNNIWVKNKLYNPKLPTILLNSHIDTVPPSDSWTKVPFAPTEEDNTIFGLGSNDAGASLVSLLAAFIFFYDKNLKYNLIFLASAEEEVSGKNGIESVIPNLGKIDFAIVGEPTKMEAAIAEKGLMVVDCCAKGISGHAARDEGLNSIDIAIKDIQTIKSLNLNKISDLLGKTKLTVTQINAGSKHNVIPDICNFVIDVRTNELYSNREIFEILKSNLDSELKARSFRLNSSSISENHPLMEQIKKMGIKTYGSPTLSDQALINFPSLKMGPGDSARSHTADEYIHKSEIIQGIKTYINILQNIM